MFTVLIVLHVLLAAGLIAIVLVQRGPGATMGAAFGSGASGTVFGSRGASNFLTRTTSWLAVGFFGISLTMAVLAAGGNREATDDLGVVGALESSAADAANDADAAVDAVIEQLDSEPREASGDDAQADGADDQSGNQASGNQAGNQAASAEDESSEVIPEPPVD
ncbi:preprotein translocase subunit SecG [Halomonas denitrificans]|nr:preprotein translocase subunit SecG [Halomonas denitrificans]